MLLGGRALAQAEEPVGKPFPIVSKHHVEPYWASALQVAQEASGVGGGLKIIEIDEPLNGLCVQWRQRDSVGRVPQPSEGAISD